MDVKEYFVVLNKGKIKKHFYKSVISCLTFKKNTTCTSFEDLLTVLSYQHTCLWTSSFVIRSNSVSRFEISTSFSCFENNTPILISNVPTFVFVPFHLDRSIFNCPIRKVLACEWGWGWLVPWLGYHILQNYHKNFTKMKTD